MIGVAVRRRWLGLASCLVLLTTAASGQQNPDGVVQVAAMGDPYLLLLHDPAVHRELKLDDRQRRAMVALCDQIDAELWSVRNKPAAQADELLGRLKVDAQKRLPTILTEGQQRRLREVELRTLGWRALLREDAAQRFEISASQQEKIRAILKRTSDSVAALAKEAQSGKPREPLERQAQKLREDEQKEVWELLSRSQQTRLRTALGESFDLSRLGRIQLKAPEFAGGETWINSKPLQLSQQRGKLTVLFFWTYG